jgi:N-acetylneuraminic acid mutarotase
MKTTLLFFAVTALSAPAFSQSRLMTYGDVLGAPTTLALSNVAPGTRCMIIPSMSNNGSNALIGMSGDANDSLLVGVDLAANGTRFTKTSNAQGIASVTITIPASPSMLDRAVYWQGFEWPSGGSGTTMFANFSNMRTMSLNTGNRWQAEQSNAPVSAALQAYIGYSSTGNGGADRVFACGGGPVVLTDVTSPFATKDRAWEYNLENGTHTLLSGTMNDSRAFHNGVKLQDGRFMVIGGNQGPYGSAGNYYTKILNTCEIYDPATGTWSNTANMFKYRAGATALVLPDGRVIVAGGSEGNSSHNLADVADLLGTALKTTEIYNPATNSWSWGPNMSEPKAGAMSVVLNDGRWMIAGGITHVTIFGLDIPDFSANISIYNPTTNSFSNAGTMKDKRALGAMTVMGNGNVFIAGGGGGDILNIGPIRKTEVYNPSNSSTTRKSDLSNDSAFGVAVTLANGTAMVIGGANGSLDDPAPINNCWIYNDANGSLSAAASMPEAHAGGVVVAAEDGTVFISGGETNNGLATGAARSYSPN